MGCGRLSRHNRPLSTRNPDPAVSLAPEHAFSPLSTSSIGPPLMSQQSAVSSSSLLPPESGSSFGQYFLQPTGRRVALSQAYGSSFGDLPSMSSISLGLPFPAQLAPALGSSSSNSNSDLSSPLQGMTLQGMQSISLQVTSVTPDAGPAPVRSLGMQLQHRRQQQDSSSNGSRADDQPAEAAAVPADSSGSSGTLQPDMLQTLSDLHQMGHFAGEQSLRHEVIPWLCSYA